MCSERLNIRGLLALRSNLDLEADLLAIVKRFEALRFHF
jgi:hypothetical protein